MTTAKPLQKFTHLPHSANSRELDFLIVNLQENILRDYKIQDIDPTQYTAAEVERYNILSKALKKGSVKDMIGLGLGRDLFSTLVMGGITYKEAEQILYDDDE